MATKAPIDWGEPVTDAVALRPAQEPIPETGFGENFYATREEMELVGNTNSSNTRMRDAYQPLVDALEQAGAKWGEGRHFLNPASLPEQDTAAYNSSVPARSQMRQMIFEEVRRRKAVDKTFLSDVPDNPEAFEAVALQRNTARLQELRRVQAGASSTGAIGGFIGGVAGAFEDPINLWTMPFGGASKTVIGAAARSALENALIETVSQPEVIRNYAELGEAVGIGDSLRMILFAAGAGGAFGGAMKAAGLGIGKAGHAYDKLVTSVFEAMPQPVRERWGSAATIDDRLLIDALRATSPEEAWTPELRAAANVVERDAEIRDASPFNPGAMADEAHAERLSAALQRIISGAPPISVRAEVLSSAAPVVSRTTPAAANSGPASVAAELRAGGLPEPVVAGFLGNFDVEDGYGGAVGDGGTAFGIAQWRHERVVHFERVIGVHPSQASHSQQARFVRWEMDNPAAAGMTVAQRDAILAARTPEEAARLIDRYYERSDGKHRERRAAAAQRHVGGEAAPVREEAPAIRADADEMEPPRIVEEVIDEAEEMPSPVLRRELFDNDDDWAAAQAAYERSGEDAAAAFRGNRASLPANDTGDGLDTIRSLTDFLTDPRPLAQMYQAGDVLTFRGGIGEVISSDDKSVVVRFAEGDERVIARGDPDLEPAPWRIADIRRSPDDSSLAQARVASGWLPDGLRAAQEAYIELTGKPITQTEIQRLDNALDSGASPKVAASSVKAFFDRPIDWDRERAEFAEHLKTEADPAGGLRDFDAPQGEGPRTLADSLEHDIRIDLADTPDIASKRFMIDDAEAKLSDILDDLESEKAFVAAIRGCL